MSLAIETFLSTATRTSSTSTFTTQKQIHIEIFQQTLGFSKTVCVFLVNKRCSRGQQCWQILYPCFEWQSVWLGIGSRQAVPIDFYACNPDKSYSRALAMFRTAILRYNSTVVPNQTASLTNLTRGRRRWHHTFIDPDATICVYSQFSSSVRYHWLLVLIFLQMRRPSVNALTSMWSKQTLDGDSI